MMLKNQVAVIYGAGGAVGSAVARAFAREGAKLFLTGRHRAPVEAVALVALGVMSVTWMSVIAVLVIAQKLLPPRAAVDVPPALAIVGLGILIVIAPSLVPGPTPPM
jgi:NAD(P)-dependent dehydrogenase (short-subunit alcohol dehydrogenase family)